VLPERLPEGLRSPATPAAAVVLGPGFDLDAHLQAVEAGLLRQALEESGGERGEAARRLGVTARQLRYLLQKHGSQLGGPQPDKNWHS
jgi:two-component system response regulator PilR (NtrC family)